MKITRESISGKTITFIDVEDAVVDAATVNPYSYDKKIEKLEQENEKLRNMFARLMKLLYTDADGELLKPEQVKYILGYGYEVEE